LQVYTKDRKFDKKMCPIPQKTYNITKRLKTSDEVEQHFPGFIAFRDSTEQQQIPRPVDKRKRKVYYSGNKKIHTAVKIQLMVNNDGIIIHKLDHKKGRRDMTMKFIKRISSCHP